jgi:homoserine dehydrogenase
MKTIKIGIAGFGTVGAGVVDILQCQRETFAQIHGIDLEITTIVARDLKRDRGVSVAPSLLTTDFCSLKDVDLVVELIGGDTVAKNVILKSLQSGKAVVTANKALLADHWDEVFEAVREHNGLLRFEATVAGAVPIVKTVQESLAGNRIQSLKGIINGTANYILTEMESRHIAFSDILKEAQDKGYAETDPVFDIEGIDTAHKLAILVRLAYGTAVTVSEMHVEGITVITLDDILYAKELGYRIKLLAIAKRHEEAVEARVHPTMVPLSQVLSAVSGAYNAVDVFGDVSGDILLYGQGAGRYPTASAVVGDILDVAKQLASGYSFDKENVPLTEMSDIDVPTLLVMDQVQTRYYLRLGVCDKSGVLAQITSIFGEHNISIASVIQKELKKGEMVPLVIMTDMAREENMQKALKAITVLESVDQEAVLIRVED